MIEPHTGTWEWILSFLALGGCVGEGVTSKEWLCVSTDDIEVVGLDVLGDLLLEGVSGEVFVDEDCGGLTGDLDVVLSLCSLAMFDSFPLLSDGPPML